MGGSRQVSVGMQTTRMFSAISRSVISNSTRRLSTGEQMSRVVVLAAGRDRTGIVANISGAISEEKGTIQEGRMAVLAGECSMLFFVKFPASVTADSILSKLSNGFPDFTIATRTSGEYKEEAGKQRYEVVCTGPDQPGVLRKLTGVFKDYGCNVHDINTDTSAAPFAGYQIFSVKSQIAAPQHFDIAKF